MDVAGETFPDFLRPRCGNLTVTDGIQPIGNGRRNSVSEATKPSGPDFSSGISISGLTEIVTQGRVGDQAAILVRTGTEWHILGAYCSHYHAPLADGLLANGHLRCPWHHACFDIRTGEAVRAPAFTPLTTWDVEELDGKIYAREKRARPKSASPADRARSPDHIVIVGGGAAGFAAAEQLRRRGYQASIVMLSDDPAPPVDRPNLSKDYLAGQAPEDWIPLRSSSFYEKQAIDLRLGRRAKALDIRAHELTLDNGETLPFERLLLATGSRPNRLPVPGGDQPRIQTLRTLADSRAIIEQANVGKRAIVVGASFMGLEVAAALRERGLEVHVVAPAQRPLERVFGPQMGDFIRTLHEEHGVVFHLQQAVAAIDDKDVHLKSGEVLRGDLIIAAVGVQPRTELAQKAGLAVDRGVVVDRFLETSAPGVFAAGDITRWPDPRTGELIRVEHWVVAQRQGQVAALNMLDRSSEYTNVPFFWSQHYDVRINYVGHAEDWDELAVEGNFAGRDCLLRFKKQGRVLAAASIGRDLDNLRIEMAMERS